MTPALADGATVTVRERRIYLPGDVLVFRTRAGNFAAHRMLGWRRAAVVTKGDHCEIHDAPVAMNAIIGAVDMRIEVKDRVSALASYARIILRRLTR